MSITVKSRSILGMQVALNKLDGYNVVEEVAHPQDPDQTVKMLVRKPYKFDGNVRRGLGRCLAAVNGAADDLADEQARLEAEHAVADTVPDSERARVEGESRTRINEAMQEYLDGTYELTCDPVSVTGLHLDENPVPVSVLSLIDPFLKD